MKAWVDTQDPSEMTLIGDPFAALRNPLSNNTDSVQVTVTFCSTKSGTVCTAPCTTVTSEAACINAPGTNCLFATSQVAFAIIQVAVEAAMNLTVVGRYDERLLLYPRH